MRVSPSHVGKTDHGLARSLVLQVGKGKKLRQQQVPRAGCARLAFIVVFCISSWRDGNKHLFALGADYRSEKQPRSSVVVMNQCIYWVPLHAHWVSWLVLIIDLTQPRVTWTEETSAEERLQSNWPVAISLRIADPDC